MQLRVDSAGMEIDVDLDTENNADARALYSAVSRGDITGMSFMFAVGDEEWDNIDTDHPTRRIKEISSVVEVSAVTFPCICCNFDKCPKRRSTGKCKGRTGECEAAEGSFTGR